MSKQTRGKEMYTEMVAALASNFHPTPSPIVQRFKFHSHIPVNLESRAGATGVTGAARAAPVFSQIKWWNVKAYEHYSMDNT